MSVYNIIPKSGIVPSAISSTTPFTTPSTTPSAIPSATDSTTPTAGLLVPAKTQEMINRNNAAADEARMMAAALLKSLKRTNLQICTAESITGGLIMSTLSDIPLFGKHKYGGFIVYDTDAKRTMLGVTTNHIYSHECASQMAIGALKNSNATIAIAVTGHAMPSRPNALHLGEVYIGIAGYTNKDHPSIICQTTITNVCKSGIPYRDLCKKWVGTIRNSNMQNHNPVDETAILSQLIRYTTVKEALSFCNDFINTHDVIVPEFIHARKKRNTILHSTKKIHHLVPPNKYTYDIRIIQLSRRNDRNHVLHTNTPVGTPAAAAVASTNEGGRRRLKRTRKQKR